MQLSNINVSIAAADLGKQGDPFRLLLSYLIIKYLKEEEKKITFFIQNVKIQLINWEFAQGTLSCVNLV